jgi:hypothetical protein
LYSGDADARRGVVDTADPEQDFATYRRKIDLARQAAGQELDEMFFIPIANQMRTPIDMPGIPALLKFLMIRLANE